MESVKYIKEIYTSTGNIYYYKQLWIVEGYWSKMRPITETTYKKAKRDGKPCYVSEVTQPLATVENLFTWKLLHKKELTQYENRQARPLEKGSH